MRIGSISNRLAIATLSVATLGVALASCKNTLTFGGGSRDCKVSGTICSVGDPGFGDGADLSKIGLIRPTGIAIDPAGGFLIADAGQNSIRSVDATGKVTTIAGTGRHGSELVTGIPALEADLSSPFSVAKAADGWVFWNDLETCNVYGLDPATKFIEVIAGSGQCDAEDDGPEPGSGISFGERGTISVDSLGNILVAEDAYRVRYVNRTDADVTVWGVLAPAHEITTLAGKRDYNFEVSLGASGVSALTGAGSLFYPTSAWEGPGGILWIADAGHSAVRYVDAAGLIYTYAGGNGSGTTGDGGFASGAKVLDPGTVYPDASGRLWILDAERVRVIAVGQGTTFGGITVGSAMIESIAGGVDLLTLQSDGGPALNQTIEFGDGAPVALDANGDLLVVDPGNGVIRKIDHTTGTMSVIAGFTPGGTRATSLHRPAGVAVDRTGSIFVNARNAHLNRIDASGTVTSVAGNGSEIGTGDGGPATSAGYWGTAVAIGSDDAIYIADPFGHRVRRLDSTGVIGAVAGDGGGGNSGDAGPAINASLAGPFGIAFDSSGNLFVLGYESVRFVNRGISTTTVAGVTIGPGNIDRIAGGNGVGNIGDGGPARSAQFAFNYGGTDLATGAVVYQNGLYVSDTMNNRIRRIDLTTGIVTPVVGSGAPSATAVGHPVGLAVRGDTLYWAQQDGSMVKRMKLPAGPVELVAGDGFDGNFGDNGAGATSELYKPEGLAVGPDGAIYIADGTHHVRRIQP